MATFLHCQRLIECSSQVPGFQFPRFRLQTSAIKELPHHKCKAPTVPGAFSPFALSLCFGWANDLALSGEADFAVKGHCSRAIEDEHDCNRGKRNDVVIDSEALMNANDK